MKYKSLLDFGKDEGMPFCMEWKGSMNGVLKYVKKISEDFSYSSDYSKKEMALAAPRIVRGVLDYKISYPTKKVTKVVQSATDTAMRIYSDPNSGSQQVDGFLDVLKETRNLGILKARVSQPYDEVTWKYSVGGLCKKSAEYLANFFDGKDVLFLLAGHGGVMAGLDVSLRYKAITDNDNCIVYPMRFSFRKKRDSQPMSSYVENKYLLDVSKGKKIVVFDEDVFSGATMLGFKKFLRENLFPRKPIVLKSNYKSVWETDELEQIIASETG